MTGTWINVCTVVAGGMLGLLLGNRLSEGARQTVMRGLGLVTLVAGIQMALATRNILIVMFSILLGGVVGEALRIEARMKSLGDALQRRFAPGGTSPVSEAFVTTSLLFCVGPMAVLGALQDGLAGDYRLLAIKSLLDGFASMAFAAALGWGVLLSAVTVLVYQGGIALTAMLVVRAGGGINGESAAIAELGATGGVLVMAIGLLLLDIKHLPVGNYLPALAAAPLIAAALEALGRM